MGTLRVYSGDDRMSDLICDHFSLLVMMDRFGIGLGFSDCTISEVCKENGVDTATFLAVVNLLLGGRLGSVEGLSLGGLVDYLRASHRYYLDVRLPGIRSLLVECLGDDTISRLILRYFDDFTAEVRSHLEYEESHVFPYALSLLKGERTMGYSIEEFSSSHDHIESPLSEFKNVIIKYYKGPSSAMIGVIHDILSCARDLSSHNLVEDRLLVPLIRSVENGGK